MDIPEILQKTGLNQKEALVYMALLELGTSSVEGIAKKAGTKRPTTYLILDDLQRRGLATLVPRSKKVLYTAETPEKIVSDLGNKQELIKRYLPNLLALYNSKKEKPQVLLFEGEEAVRGVYKELLQAKEIDIFCTISDVLSVYPDTPKILAEGAERKQTKVRELLAKNETNIEFAKSIKHSDYYQHRFTSLGQQFLTDNVLADDKVVFFSYQPHIFAVMIQSKTIYRSLHTLFELAWTQAEPYEKVIKE